jgi:uncharacterized protein (TIRG00374 family)
MRIDFNELQVTVSQTNGPFLTILYLIFIPGTLLSSYKWKILLRGQGITKPGFIRLWGLYFVGMFFSNFLPTEVGGDLFRGYEVGKIAGDQSRSMAAVLTERATGLFALICYALIGLFLNWQISNELNFPVLVSGVFMVTGLVLILFLNRNLARHIKKILAVPFLQKISNKIEKLYEAFYEYKRQKKVFFYAMALSFIFQLLAICYSYGLLRTIGVEIPFVQFILAVPVISIISIIPITVNSIGLREGAFVYIFTFLGTTTAEAFTLAVLYRIGMIIPSIVGSIIYVAHPEYREDKKTKAGYVRNPV